MTLVEPIDPEPGFEALTGTVLDDERLLLDLGASPHPVEVTDVVVSCFTPDALVRVTGMLVLADEESAQYELVVKDVEHIQRRRSRRAAIELGASLVALGTAGPVVSVRGRTRDLSAGGCRVVTERPLPQGTEPMITLDLLDGPPVIAQASIICTRRDGTTWDYRLMFTAIDDEDRSRLDDLCAA